MQTTEINGFLIDDFNQHKLEEGKKQGYMPYCVLTLENLKIKRQNVRLMIGNGVSVLVTTVTHTFQLHTYKRKGENVQEYMRNLNNLILNILD